MVLYDVIEIQYNARVLMTKGFAMSNGMKCAALSICLLVRGTVSGEEKVAFWCDFERGSPGGGSDNYLPQVFGALTAERSLDAVVKDKFRKEVLCEI